MGKNHRRRTKQSDQVHDHGWMSGFVSLFDFRRGGGGSNHSLPSSSRYGYSQDISSIYNYDSSYDISQPIHGGARKQSVKSLIDEEMVTERKLKRNESFLEYVDFANDADTNSLVREILIRIQKKSSKKVDQKPKQKNSFWDLPERIRAKFIQQLTDATKVLLQEKVIGKVPVGVDGKCQYSREFVEALETLMSHKDLLYNLLDDPNSELTRSIDHLINSELRKLEVRDLRSEDPYRYSIVETSSGNLMKTKYSFSFDDFKKMLKRAIWSKGTKNELSARSISRRHQILRTNGETGWMSPSTNPHLEVEVHPRRLSNSRRSDVDMEVSDRSSENEITTPLLNKLSNKNLQQSKQRYYLLSDEILYEKFPKRRDIDLMLKCFSMPDRPHPPPPSPSRPVRQSSMPIARTRMPSFKRSLSLKMELNTNAAVESHDLNPIAPETVAFSGGDDGGKLSVKSSSGAPTVAYSDEQNDVDEHKTEKSDNRPSPTSVLEPIDETSPPRTEATKGEQSITPLQLRFEEMENSPESESDSDTENEWQLKKHVTEILIASDFSWETCYIRYLTSDHLLDISLLESDDDTNSDHLRNNYMLTFDLLNEVLEDKCGRYFSYSPWVPFKKSSFKLPTTSDAENSYEQILEEIELHLLTMSEVEDVEQIVRKEVFKDGSLTDFGLDVETIGGEISDLILQKLVIDTALSCFSFTDKNRLVHL